MSLKTKTCSTCSKRKTLERYGIMPHGLLGRSASCKDCCNAWSKVHAQKPDVKAKRTWRNMRARCYKEADISYPNYGGRGIKVCKQWQSREKFLVWYNATKVEGLVLDRRNNDGDYKPSNCRWTTLNIQNKNKRVTEKQLSHMRRLGKARAERFKALREGKGQ